MSPHEEKKLGKSHCQGAPAGCKVTSPSLVWGELSAVGPRGCTVFYKIDLLARHEASAAIERSVGKMRCSREEDQKQTQSMLSVTNGQTSIGEDASGTTKRK
eukprot:1160428-Pelagomonas_calceolata.AAC.12